MAGDGFELVCEVEPPTRPDLKRVRHQIGVMSPIADAFLNGITRQTVIRLAKARGIEVIERAIAHNVELARKALADAPIARSARDELTALADAVTSRSS